MNLLNIALSFSLCFLLSTSCVGSQPQPDNPDDQTGPSTPATAPSSVWRNKGRYYSAASTGTVTTAIDIKAKYDTKCGPPSAGSPKVFFKYF